MSENSKIEWTDNTFNPWEGCVKISPACDNCYAAARDNRMHAGNNWGNYAARLPHVDEYWLQPLKWNRDAEKSGKRARVFCGSLCDVMEDRPDLHAHRLRLYPLIEQTPNLDWLLLTKRPQNFRRFLPVSWMVSPRPNVCGMTTVESNAYRWRIDALTETPFLTRGLSCEPLLDDLRLDPYLSTGLIDWVITGGESGQHARPSHPDWFRSVRDQCKSSGVAFFFKQWGSFLYSTIEKDDSFAGETAFDDPLGVRVSGVVARPTSRHYVLLPDTKTVACRVKRVKDSGRLLDGVEHNEFPA